MGYLDYTQPKAWGGLGEQAQGNLFKIGDLLQKQRSTAAYEAQVEAQNKALAEKALKDKTDEALKEADRRRDIATGVTNLLGKGRRGAAEALATSSRFADPRNPGGPLLGVGYHTEEAGPAPTPTAVAPEEPLPDFVQVMTPQQARTKAIHDALVKQGRPVDQPPAANDLATEAAATEAEGLAQRTQDARQQYPAKKALYESEAAADAAKKKAYDEQVANPKVTLDFPNAGKVTINPSEERDYHRQDLIEEAAKLRLDANREPDPHTRERMLRSADLLEHEIPNFEKSIIANTASASQAQQAHAGQQEKKLASDKIIQAGHDRARIIAAGLHGQGGGLYPDAKEARIMSEYEKNLADVTRKGGLRDQLDMLEESLANIRDDPKNSTVWTNGIDGMIRTKTGKAAILNQYNLYTGKSAGLLDALNWFKARVDGEQLSPAQKANLFGAMVGSNNELVDRMNQALSVAEEYDTDERVVKSPALKLGIERTKHSAFRGGKRKKPTDTTVPGHPDVPLPGAPKGKRITLKTGPDKGKSGTLMPGGTMVFDSAGE